MYTVLPKGNLCWVIFSVLIFGNRIAEADDFDDVFEDSNKKKECPEGTYLNDDNECVEEETVEPEPSEKIEPTAPPVEDSTLFETTPSEAKQEGKCPDGSSSCAQKSNKLYVSLGIGYRRITGFDPKSEDETISHVYNVLPMGSLGVSYHYFKRLGLYGNLTTSPTLHQLTDASDRSWITLYPNIFVSTGLVWDFSLGEDKLHIMPNVGFRFTLPTSNVYNTRSSTMFGSNVVFMIRPDIGAFASIQTLNGAYLSIPEDMSIEGEASPFQFMTGLTVLHSSSVVGNKINSLSNQLLLMFRD